VSYRQFLNDFRHSKICLVRHRWSRRGVAGRVSWVQRVQPYMDGWAATSEYVVTEDRPHDDTAWEGTSSGTPRGLGHV
jgi:hypothetical protein